MDIKESTRRRVQFEISRELDVQLRKQAKLSGLSYSAFLNRMLRQSASRIL